RSFGPASPAMSLSPRPSAPTCARRCGSSAAGARCSGSGSSRAGSPSSGRCTRSSPARSPSSTDSRDHRVAEATAPAAFWRSALAYGGSAPPQVLPHVLPFTAMAAVVTLVHSVFPRIAVAVGPIEVSGAALALLLVLRTNAGYERWWEGRKLWGGIVNQSRHLGVVAISYGPEDSKWRGGAPRPPAGFSPPPPRGPPARRGRSPRAGPLAAPGGRRALLGAGGAGGIAAARHMPVHVALLIADHLRVACDQFEMDRFSFLEADRDLTSLLDFVGGCERIKKTPLPRAYAIQIRQFL